MDERCKIGIVIYTQCMVQWYHNKRSLTCVPCYVKRHPMLSKHYNSLLLVLMLAQTYLKDYLGKAFVHSGF